MMRTQTSTSRREAATRGVVLVPVVLVAILMTGLAGAFLRVAVAHSRESVATTAAAQTFYVAEAGINAAIAEIASRVDVGGDGLGTVSGSVGGAAYQVVATPIGADGDDADTDDDEESEWRIESLGNWGAARRTLQVVIRANPSRLFMKKLFSEESLVLTGEIFTDSYDSRLGSYASQATNYDSRTELDYALSNGDVGSNRGIDAGGRITVMGDATPGPGYNVRVGNDAYVSGSVSPATQTIPLPPPVYAPVGPNLGAFLLGGVSVRLFGPGTYHYSTFRTGTNATTICTGDVTLYVDSDFEIGGFSRMVLAPGARVTIHHGSGYFEISGNGVANAGEKPTDFIVYSSTGSTPGEYIEVSGRSKFFGAVYAPLAPLALTGDSETFGSFVANRIMITGDSIFHYDEALAEIPGQAPEGFTLRSWRETSVHTFPYASSSGNLVGGGVAGALEEG